MKTFLPALIAATLLGLLALFNPPAWLLTNALALAFILGLGLWTLGQYRRTPRVLNTSTVLPFPGRAARSVGAGARETRWAA